MKNKTLTIDKKIEKLVQNSRIGLTPVKVIQDIAQLAYNCLKKSIELRGWRYHEADWLIRSLDEYKNDPASWEVIQELTVEYIEMVKNNPPFTDIFELIGFPNNKLAKQLGQFLTPSKLATGASKFVEVAIQGDKNITICDIGGCGAGSMLLAPLRTLYEDTPNKLNQAHLLV